MPGAVQGRDHLVQDGQPTGATPGLGQPPAVSTAPPDIRTLDTWDTGTLDTCDTRTLDTWDTGTLDTWDT